MNQTQTKYLRERAQVIYARRKKVVRDKFAVKPLTVAQKIAAIKADQFEVKPNQDGKYGLDYSLTFPAEAQDNAALRDSALATIDREFTALLDELILGDNEEALRLLKAFDRED